jgi:hypothetical protein
VCQVVLRYNFLLCNSTIHHYWITTLVSNQGFFFCILFCLIMMDDSDMVHYLTLCFNISIGSIKQNKMTKCHTLTETDVYVCVLWFMINHSCTFIPYFWFLKYQVTVGSKVWTPVGIQQYIVIYVVILKWHYKWRV